LISVQGKTARTVDNVEGKEKGNAPYNRGQGKKVTNRPEFNKETSLPTP